MISSLIRVDFDHAQEPLEQEDNGAGSYDGFTLVQSSRPRSANAGHGVQRVNIGSFKGKFYNLKSFEADFIDKMKSNDHIEQYYGVLHSDDYREQEEMKDPIAYTAKLGDGDL